MKILLVNECSLVQSGLGKIGKNLLTYLKSQGHTVAEFVCYMPMGALDDSGVSWPMYYNQPHNNDPRYKTFISDHENKQGRYRFDATILDFKPDWVIIPNDVGIATYINSNPLRKHFNFLYLPTIDSLPVPATSAADLLRSDEILYYSDWASKNFPRAGAVTRFGVNENDFYEIPNKKLHKISMGLTDAPVIGCIMKNQIRKSVDQLFKIFRKVLNECPDTILQFHTGTADPKGWNIPRMLIENNIEQNVKFTYHCSNPECCHLGLSNYKTECAYCPSCKKKSYLVKYGSKPIADEDLNKIINCYDIYLQASSAEGACIPIVEAAYCGVDLCIPHFSAMEDFARTLGVDKHIPKIIKTDFHMTSERAVLDEDDMAQCLIQKIKTKSYVKDGKKIKEKARDIYNWDEFGFVINQTIINSRATREPWDAPKKIYYPINKSIDYIELFEFIKKHNMFTEHGANILINDMIEDAENAHPIITRQDSKSVIQRINQYISYMNHLENLRSTGDIIKLKEDWLEHARAKQKS